MAPVCTKICITFVVCTNIPTGSPLDVKNGHIRRVVDDEVKSLVLEISGTNVATSYISCPIKPRASLGIKLPFLVMVIKNMKRYFTFEIQILDDKDMHRRFRVSNFQSTTKVKPFCTTMPIGLSDGWNQVQFNLADFTKRAYGSTYMETTRVQIHANVRIRRIYFSDTLYSDEEMPNEFKLFAPIKKKGAETKASKDQAPEVKKQEEEVPPPPSPVDDEVMMKVVGSDEGVAAPSPADASPSEPVEGATEDEVKEESPGEPSEPPGESAEPAGEATEGESPPPTEGEEGAPTEEGAPPTEGGEITGDAATTEEPATTTEEPATTDEPTTETATTEEPATTDVPTESESEPPPE